MRCELDAIVESAGGLGEHQYERSQEAIRQLWTLLEMKHRPASVLSDPGFYEQVPDVLRSETLGDDEEEELVAELKRLVMSPHSETAHIGLIGLLSMTTSRIGLGPVLDLIYDETRRYTDEEARSLVIALDRMLDICQPAARTGEDDEPLTGHAGEVVARLRERDPRALLTAMVRTRSRRAAEAALWTWRTTQLLLGTPAEVHALHGDYSSSDLARAHLMKPVLRQLVDAAGDRSEPERRRAAISDIALLLKARNGVSPEVAADALLPESLRGLSFTADDEEDLLGELRELLLSPDSAEVRPELIAALRGTAAWHSVHPLLDLLIDRTEALTDEELQRLLEALDEKAPGPRLPEAHTDSCQASHVASLCDRHWRMRLRRRSTAAPRRAARSPLVCPRIRGCRSAGTARTRSRSREEFLPLPLVRCAALFRAREDDGSARRNERVRCPSRSSFHGDKRRFRRRWRSHGPGTRTVCADW